MLQGISQCDLSKDMWYLGTGESGHMTGEKRFLCDLDEAYNGRVRFGDGSRGKILLNSIDNAHVTLKKISIHNIFESQHTKSW